MRFKKIIHLFKDGSVCVFGKRGSGKDLLTGNIIVRRKLPYISNIDYGGKYIPFNYNDLDVGGNYYPNFISGNIKPYSFKYPDGTDVYISDAGIYFPSQYCSELNKNYPQMPVYQALCRHTSNASFHTNSQALGRVWDKIREQSETFILCRKCIYIKGLVFQWVTIYDRYDSANQKQRPLKLPMPMFANKEMRLQRDIQYAQFEAAHGSIKNAVLIYRNKSTYDTRRFKAILKGENQ